MIHTPSDPCECGLAMWVERWVATKEGPKMLSDWVKRVRCAGCDKDKPKRTEPS